LFLIILRLVLKAIRSTSSRTSFGAKNPKIHKNNKQNKTKGSGMTAGKNRRPCYLREEVFPGESGSQRSHGPWEEARRPRVGRHIRSGRHTAAVQIQRVWTVPWCLRLPLFSTRRSRSGAVRTTCHKEERRFLREKTHHGDLPLEHERHVDPRRPHETSLCGRVTEPADQQGSGHSKGQISHQLEPANLS